MISHRQLAKIFYKAFPALLWRLPATDNCVYLTFDDGPYPPLTAPLLDLLRSQEIPAAFFLSGENICRHRHQLADLRYDGFCIGNHGFFHEPVFVQNRRQVCREIELTDRLINAHFGKTARFFRPPYGIFGPRLFPTLTSSGKKMVLWSVMAYDFKWDQWRILEHLYRQVRPGDIVVFHDAPSTEKVLLSVLPPFIDHCRRQGWGFADLAVNCGPGPANESASG